jgi:hypothetical protein
MECSETLLPITYECMNIWQKVIATLWICFKHVSMFCNSCQF